MKSSERKIFTLQIRSLLGALSRRTFFYFFTIVTVSLFATIGEVLTLSTIQPIIQNITGGDSFDGGIFSAIIPNFVTTPNSLMMIALVSILFTTICRLLLVWMNIDFTNKISLQLSNLMMESILKQDILFFKNQSTDEIISAFAVKISNASSTVLAITNLVSSAIIILGITVTVAAIDTNVTIPAFLVILAFYFLVLSVFRRKMHENGTIIAKMQSLLISVAQGAIGSIRDVILNQRSGTFVEAYSNGLKRQNQASAVNTFLNQSPRFVFEATFMICILLIGMAYQHSGAGDNFLGIVAVLALAAQRLIPLLQQAYSALANVYSANQAIADVCSFIDFTKLRNKSVSKIENEPIKSLSVVDISFSYVDDQPLLSNISFQASRGDFFVIMGPTGSGKSSLLDIIFGLISPSSGHVTINDQRRIGTDPSNLNGRVGFVAQKIFILNDSIKANVAFSVDKKDYDEDRVIECCRSAMFLDESDVGGFLNRPCGENGSKLSGGQIQRLALARALYQDPDILVLDEFGSGLDKATLISVIKNLKKKCGSKIILYVTHSELVLEEATNCFMLDRKLS